MKKLVTLCLVSVLILSSFCVGWAYYGEVSVTPMSIQLGEGYVNNTFTTYIDVTNNGPGYRSITIDIPYNNLGLKADQIKFTLPSYQSKSIRITGKFPSWQGSFSASLIVKDDSSYGSENIVYINGYAKQ